MTRMLSTLRGQAVVSAVAVALCLPSITTGLVADDWFHELQVEHRPIPGMSTRPLDLFTFANGIPEDTHRLIDAGVFPWWADPEVKLAFLRPITSLSHALDYVLWRDSPAAMHLQNLAWFLLALLAVAWSYRRLLPPVVAGWAVLLFAMDNTHGPAVAWIANRNVMVAVAISLPALVFHHRWRTEGWRPGAWLGPLFFGAGLLGGESAIATAGYLFAHALHVEQRRWRDRALGLAPYLGVLVVWRIVYTRLGYGAAHSGVYFDPAHETGAFLAALPARAAALLTGEFAGPWSDFAGLYEYLSKNLALVMSALAFATVLIVAVAFTPLWRRNPTTRMFATGSLLATLPICATFPADRLLYFVSIGAMALVAQFIAEQQRGWRRLVTWGFVLVHVVLAPPVLALRSQTMKTVDKPLERALQSLPRDAGVENKTLILVNPPGDMLAGYLLLGLAARNEPRPKLLRWLAAGSSSVSVHRDDATTLTVTSHEAFTHLISEQMLRSPTRPMPAGTMVRLTGVTIEVLSDNAGQPTSARFRFDLPVDDSSFIWMQWGKTGYVPFKLPALGGDVDLAPVNVLEVAFAP